ncbi:hypothetical protein [Muricauda sp. MAR_2010_75]|uniref:hypothetical protein n=1 Tax=Allomuricauda sp. MAR_2010_75 TaxID=1250232 RepID=UPI000568B5C4|nr:hypothetical protein [Muricauda sp. MAR_2010_75]
MSWENRLNNIKFKITTGDGKTFTPLWVNGETSVEFSTKKYEFINVPGSMIERKKRKANQYPLVFYFQGEDNIDVSESFMESANDSRPWQVNHPFYGLITGQPTAIQRVDDSYNVTKISVDFWETITEDYPNETVSPKDIISAKSDSVNILATSNYTAGARPTSADISPIKDNSKKTASKFSPYIPSDQYIPYNNALSTAVKAVDNIVVDAETVMSSNQELLLIPSTFEIPVPTRLKALLQVYQELKSVITGKNGKFYFESQAATLITSIATATVNPLADDYITKGQVQESSSSLVETYNDYLLELDNAQVDQYDVDNSWSPNPELQQSLYELVMDTVGNLYNLAFGAKQERIVEVETDTNLIILAHRYMGGLDIDDKKLETFRTINNIRNNELFQIKKGRQIKYFT